MLSCIFIFVLRSTVTLLVMLCLFLWTPGAMGQVTPLQFILMYGQSYSEGKVAQVWVYPIHPELQQSFNHYLAFCPRSSHLLWLPGLRNHCCSLPGHRFGGKERGRSSELCHPTEILCNCFSPNLILTPHFQSYFDFFVAVCSTAQVAFHILDITHGFSPNGDGPPLQLWIHFLMTPMNW